MKEIYERPEVIEQETLGASSGAADMLPYDPFLPFTASGTLPSTGGDPKKASSNPAGPLVAITGGLLAVGGAVAGWFSRRRATDRS